MTCVYNVTGRTQPLLVAYDCADRCCAVLLHSLLTGRLRLPLTRVLSLIEWLISCAPVPPPQTPPSTLPRRVCMLMPLSPAAAASSSMMIDHCAQRRHGCAYARPLSPPKPLRRCRPPAFDWRHELRWRARLSPPRRLWRRRSLGEPPSAQREMERRPAPPPPQHEHRAAAPPRAAACCSPNPLMWRQCRLPPPRAPP